MNFEDEPYVRFYTRDTKTWLKLGFEGQTVLMHLLRKVDRAGVLDDVTDPVDDVALVIRAPIDFVRVGLERLLKTATVEIRGARLVVPRFVEGQTAIKTDRLRSAELRKRRRDLARAGLGEMVFGDEVEPDDDDVTPDSETMPSVTVPSLAVTSASPRVAQPSRGLTRGHAASRAVTPSLAYPSLAYPNGSPLTPHPESDSTSAPVGGKRPKLSKARSQPCPPDLKPDPTTASKAWELGFSDAMRDAEVDKCIDWARSKSVLRSDWQATLRNWFRKSAEDRGLAPRKPRDAQWAYHQEQLRKASEPVKNPVKPPPGFDAALGGLFSG
jgi:hypothetical protein